MSILQNKGKESENSYQKLKRSLWTGTRKHTVTKSKYFDGHSRLSQSERANVCEHTTKMVSLEFLKGATRGLIIHLNVYDL